MTLEILRLDEVSRWDPAAAELTLGDPARAQRSEHAPPCCDVMRAGQPLKIFRERGRSVGAASRTIAVAVWLAPSFLGGM